MGLGREEKLSASNIVSQKLPIIQEQMEGVLTHAHADDTNSSLFIEDMQRFPTVA